MRFEGSRFRVQSSGCRVQGSGFRVLGSGSGWRVEGLDLHAPGGRGLDGDRWRRVGACRAVAEPVEERKHLLKGSGFREYLVIGLVFAV